MRLTREGTRILQKYQVAERAAEFEAKTPPPARRTMHGGWPVTSEPIDWKPLELCSLSIRRAIDEVANVEDIDDDDHRVWVSENRAWLFEQFELKDEPPTLQDLEEFKLKRTKQELLNKITLLEREQKGLPPDDIGLTPEYKAEVRKAFGLPAKEPPKPNPFWVAENYVRTKLDKKQDWAEQITQLVREQEWGSREMDDKEKQEVVDGYKAALSLTDKQKNFALELRQFYDSQFAAAFVSGESQQVAQTDVKLPPENVARILAEGIGKSFSSPQFAALFKDATLSEGWTSSDSLAVWYSLGNLALVVSVWTTYDDSTKATCLIGHSRSFLQKHWNTSGNVCEKLRAVVGETEPSAFASFVRCKNGKDLMMFFCRYVSRILGAPVPFSERNEFEDHMMGIKYRGDIAREAAVCEMFIKVCTATKELLHKAVIDWTYLKPRQ